MSTTASIIINIVLDLAVVTAIVGLLGWAIATQSRVWPLAARTQSPDLPGIDRTAHPVDRDVHTVDRRHQSDRRDHTRRPALEHLDRRRSERRSVRA